MEGQNHSDPGLEFAISGTLYALDLKAWSGKSTFESALAEILRREHSGTPSFSLLDVLQGVEALYAGAVANALKKDRDARSRYMDFYRYIHHVRCCSGTSDWKDFLRRLVLCIASTCSILQQNSAPVSYNTRPTRLDYGLEYLDRAQAGRATSQSPSQYVIEPPSPPGTPNSSSSSQSESRVPPSAVNELDGSDLSKYSIILKEHVDVEGGSLQYAYKNVSATPSVWRCVASWDGISAYRTGQNKREAKHAASWQMCQSLGLDIY